MSRPVPAAGGDTAKKRAPALPEAVPPLRPVGCYFPAVLVMAAGRDPARLSRIAAAFAETPGETGGQR